MTLHDSLKQAAVFQGRQTGVAKQGLELRPRQGAAVAACLGDKADAARFLSPLAGRQSEAVQASAIFNSLEFGGIKGRVVQGFPDAKELYRVLVAQPSLYKGAAPIKLGRHVGQADVVRIALVGQVNLHTIDNQVFVCARHALPCPKRDLSGQYSAHGLQRNVNAEAYTVIARSAANQGVSTTQVPLNA